MALVAEEATATQDQAVAPSPRRLGAEQLGVASGQMAAGVGNLLFALIASRLLDPGDFAHLSVFLSLYLVLSLPAASISAASAISPSAARLRRAVSTWSCIVGCLIAITSPAIGPLFHLPALMVTALGLSMPAIGPLAASRGRLYGWSDHKRLVTSLVTEPAVRLSIGVALGAAAGGVGAAAGVVVAAYAALEVARRHGRPLRAYATAPAQSSAQKPARPRGRHFAGERYLDLTEETLPRKRAVASNLRTAGWTAAAFLVLAILQSQDLIFANRLLDPKEAGAYAALSTLGGAAAFATVTVPLVLLPRAARGQKNALATALSLAAILGLAAVLVGAIAPSEIASIAFGSRYRSIGGMVVPYLAAMGLLGVARVLMAHRAATGKPKAPIALAVVVTVAQAACILAVGHSVDSIAATTVGATALLTIGLGVDELLRRPATWERVYAAGQWVRDTPRRLIAALSQPAVAAVTALTLLVALPIRLIIFRGIWLDEATSIYQAGLSFGGMLNNLQTTDVHPPLYFSILWVDAHLFGNGSLVMRLPSIIAGTLVIPAAYLAARDLWNRRTGVIAAGVATLSPMLVWYSQEARMYSMFMLWALLAMWAQTRILHDPSRKRDWVIFILASAALVWTEYFGAFQVMAQGLVFLWALRRRRSTPEFRTLLRGFLLCVIGFVALIAPLAPFCWHQFMVNQDAGKGFGTPSQVGMTGESTISIYTVLANGAWALLGYHSAAIMAALVALWPAGIFLALFLMGRRISKETTTVIAVALIPTLILLAIGEEKRSLFDIRYISGAVALMPLLAARFISGATRRVRPQAILCAALSAILLVSLADEQVNGSNPRIYDFASALHDLNAQYEPGDLLVYAPGDLNLVINYYSPQATAVPFGTVPATVTPGHKIFVLTSQTLMSGGSPAQVGTFIAKLRRDDQIVGRISKANVNVWVFEARR